MKVSFLGFVVVFLFTQNFLAQSFPYRHYGMDKGLSNNKTFDMITDSSGNIWIATDNGINKFDGNSFELYDQNNGLLSPSILELHFDNKDNLWIEGFKTGLQIIQKNDSVVTPQLQIDKINRYNNLISFDDHLYFINTSIDKLPYYVKGEQIKPILNIPITEYLFISNENQLLAGSEDGLYVIENFRATKLSIEGLNDRAILAIAESDQSIWLGSNEGIIRVINHRVIDSFPTIHPVTELTVDQYGGLWFGMKEGGGGYLSNEVNPQMIKLLDHSLPVSNVLVDKQNSVWMSTYGDGVYQFINKSLLDYSNISLNSNSPALSISNYKEDGVILGFKDHLITIDQNEHAKEIHIPKLFPTGIQSHSNEIVVVGQSTVLPIFSTLQKNELTLLFTFGTISYFDSDSIVYTCTNGTLIKNLLTTKKQKELSRITFDKNGNEKVHSITKIEDTLWLATTGSLYKIYDDAVETIHTFRGIRQLIKDENEILWVATPKGLLKLNAKHTIDTVYFAKDQINCALIQKNQIWAGTNLGLIGLKDGKTIHLTSQQGLPNNNIVCLYSQNKYLWVGTDKGFCKIDLNSIWATKTSPPLKLFFTSIETLSDTTFLPQTDLTFKSHIDYLKFNFSCVNFLTDQYTEYQYSLDNHNWISTNVFSVSISLLRHGNHSIQLRAKNNNSSWYYSEELNFIIKAPFSRTPLFFILMIMMIGVFLSVLIYIIKKNRKKKLATIREINRLRHKSLYAMMNPHFIFNSLSSIQYFVTTHQEKDANIYISKLAKLIRINLSQTLKNETSLRDELEFIELYLELEKTRFKEKFDYQIELLNLNQHHLERIEIATFLVQPLIENAIIHGILPSDQPGLISIQFSYHAPLLSIVVTDNGVGFAPKNKTTHNSLALDILKKRVELLNERKTDLNYFSIERLVENGQVKGTKATIVLHVM